MSEPLDMPQPPRPKRLNRLALVAILVLLGVALTAVFLTLAPRKRAKGASEVAEGSGPSRPAFLDREPVGAGASPVPVAGPARVAAVEPGYWQHGLGLDGGRRIDLDAMPEDPGGGPGPAPPGGRMGSFERTPAAVGAAAVATSREEAYRRALTAPVTPNVSARVGEPGPAIEGLELPGGEGGGGRISMVPVPMTQPLVAAATTGAATAGDGIGGLPPANSVAMGGPAGRDHQAFLRSAETLAPAGLKVRRDGPPEGAWIPAGSVVSAALVTAVDSDVAGPLVAQVTQDVFDQEQRRVVIPRGSRLIGAYDSQVAMGESRLLVAWSRLIFPDGTGLSFPGLPATTRSGEAGLAGSVDNHLGRVFGSALLLSILSAGAQLSQPQESAFAALSTRQAAAAAVGQELSSVAIEMLRRQMSVPPTIRIPAGTRFYVMLRGDLRVEDSGREPMTDGPR